MGFLNALKRKIERLDPVEVFEEVLSINEEDIEKLQRDQLKFGESSTGGIIGKYREEFYAEEKSRQNPLAGFGNVDGIRTGSFSRKITASVIGGILVIDSFDEKTEELTAKYPTILGLNPDSENTLKGLSRPEFIRRIRKQIGL